ncbi:fungal hydrophobin [Marasmius fiardii PR-910]|nr:fungal hydrophobin [Marasmius fiardii PR-910]
MLTKTVAVAFTFATLVAAWGQTDVCSTEVQCCNSLQNADDDSLSGLFALLGINVQDVTAQVGLTCNPISVVGVGVNSCKGQTACCENNGFNGVVALGCTNIAAL